MGYQSVDRDELSLKAIVMSSCFWLPAVLGFLWLVITLVSSFVITRPPSIWCVQISILIRTPDIGVSACLIQFDLI